MRNLHLILVLALPVGAACGGDDGGREVSDAAPDEPALSLRADASRIRVVRGGTQEIEVEVTREGGLGGEVEVDVVGLPAGVGADPVVIADGDDTATITVEALGSAEHAGPIPVTFTATGEGGLSDSLDLPCYVADAPGTVDTSFSFDGEIRYTVTDRDYDAVFDAAVDSEGRLVVTGTGQGEDPWLGWIVRFQADGSLDDSFGDGGEITGFGGEDSSADAVVADGAGGFHATIIQVTGETAITFIRKFAADGSPDGDFGTGGDVEADFEVVDVRGRGTGLVVQGYQAVVALDAAGDEEEGFDVPEGSFWNASAADADARLVLGGSGAEDTLALLRFAADGSVDRSFGEDGTLAYPAPEGHELPRITGIALAPDGSGVAIGEWRTTGGTFYENRVVLVAFDAEGAPVSDFGTSGVQVVEPVGIARGVLRQTDGRLVTLVARTDSDGLIDYRLERYQPDGGLDESFGDSGELVVEDNISVNTLVHDEAGGRVLVVGDQGGGGIYAVRLWL